jgi:hypothetical protein
MRLFGKMIFLWIGLVLSVPSGAHGAPAITADPVLQVLVRSPDLPIGWSSPRELILSLLKGPALNWIGGSVRSETLQSLSTYGHAAARLRCQGVDHWVDYGFESAAEVSRLVQHEGAGLAVFFQALDNGCLGLDEEVMEEFGLREWAKARPPLLLEFGLTEPQCEAGLQHLEALKAMPEPKKYGFALDPLRYEGATCGTLSASFVQRMGLYEPIFDRWRTSVSISELWLGQGFPGDQQPRLPRARRYRVELSDLLGPLGSQWQFEGLPSRPLSFFDPFRMYEFIAAAYGCVSRGSCSDRRLAEWLFEHGAFRVTRELSPGRLTRGVRVGRSTQTQ